MGGAGFKQPQEQQTSPKRRSPQAVLRVNLSETFTFRASQSRNQNFAAPHSLDFYLFIHIFSYSYPLLSGAEFVEQKSHFLLILPNLGLGIQFTNFLSLSLSSYSFPSSDKFSLSLFLSLADYDNHFSSIYPFPKETWFYFPGKILLTVFWANLSSFISFLLRFVVEFQFPRLSIDLLIRQFQFGAIRFYFFLPFVL